MNMYFSFVWLDFHGMLRSGWFAIVFEGFKSTGALSSNFWKHSSQISLKQLFLLTSSLFGVCLWRNEIRSTQRKKNSEWFHTNADFIYSIVFWSSKSLVLDTHVENLQRTALSVLWCHVFCEVPATRRSFAEGESACGRVQLEDVLHAVLENVLNFTGFCSLRFDISCNIFQ